MVCAGRRRSCVIDSGRHRALNPKDVAEVEVSLAAAPDDDATQAATRSRSSRCRTLSWIHCVRGTW